MVLIVDPADVKSIMDLLHVQGEAVYKIGRLVNKTEASVKVLNCEIAWNL